MNSMNNRQKIDKDQTRQQKLDDWLLEQGLTRVYLAKRMGVSISMVGKLLAGQRRTPARLKELAELGIPAELLPKPQKPRKSGPKPKHGVSKAQSKSGGEG